MESLSVTMERTVGDRYMIRSWVRQLRSWSYTRV